MHCWLTLTQSVLMASAEMKFMADRPAGSHIVRSEGPHFVVEELRYGNVFVQLVTCQFQIYGCIESPQLDLLV